MTDENLTPEPEENDIDLPTPDEEESSLPSNEQKVEQPVVKKQTKQQPVKQVQQSQEDYRAMMKDLIREDREEREIETLKSSLPKEHLEYVNKYKMTNEQIKIFVSEIKEQSMVENQPSSSNKPSILTNKSLKETPQKRTVFHNNSKDIEYIRQNYPDTFSEKLSLYRKGEFQINSKPLKK